MCDRNYEIVMPFDLLALHNELSCFSSYRSWTCSSPGNWRSNNSRGERGWPRTRKTDFKPLSRLHVSNLAPTEFGRSDRLQILEREFLGAALILGLTLRGILFGT
jgi:hypothetical protein